MKKPNALTPSQVKRLHERRPYLPTQHPGYASLVPLLFIAAVAAACALCCVASVIVQVGG